VDLRNCVDRYALQSPCKRVHNEPIPTYGHSWPQRQSVCLKSDADRARRNGDRRAICNSTPGIDAGRGVIRHRGVSDGSDGARPL